MSKVMLTGRNPREWQKHRPDILMLDFLCVMRRLIGHVCLP